MIGRVNCVNLMVLCKIQLVMLYKELKMRLKLPRNGERGFTLIEILIVAVILGTLAAIVIPSIMHLRTEGRVDAANTEHYNSQLAVLSAMIDQKVLDLTAGGTISPDNIDVSAATGNTDTIAEIDVVDYITGVLHAIYTVNDKGHITNATTTGLTNSKWEGLNYTPGSGWSD